MFHDLWGEVVVRAAGLPWGAHGSGHLEEQLTGRGGSWKMYIRRVMFIFEICKMQSESWKVRKAAGPSLGQMSYSPAKAEMVMVVRDTKSALHMASSPSM